jgi:hypothetical protein
MSTSPAISAPITVPARTAAIRRGQVTSRAPSSARTTQANTSTSWFAGYPDLSRYDWLTDPEAQARWAEFTIADDLERITCPALSLVGAGEGEEMLTQTREYHHGIGSERKQMHVFTLEEDGSYDHCMLDNHSRMQQVTFAWLEETLASLTTGAPTSHG